MIPRVALPPPPSPPLPTSFDDGREQLHSLRVLLRVPDAATSSLPELRATRVQRLCGVVLAQEHAPPDLQRRHVSILRTRVRPSSNRERPRGRLLSGGDSTCPVEYSSLALGRGSVQTTMDNDSGPWTRPNGGLQVMAEGGGGSPGGILSRSPVPGPRIPTLQLFGKVLWDPSWMGWLALHLARYWFLLTSAVEVVSFTRC